MLISVLNIKVTCEWHKAIKLNYKNTRTTLVFVLRFPSTLHRPQLTVILWRQSYRAVKHSPRSLHYDVSLPGMRSGRIWRHGRRTERGPPRSPHFSMAIISVTVQLWIYVFWVISVYFNIRNTLPKFCPFLPGHPVYMYKGNKAWFIWKDQIRNNKENIRIRSI